MQLTRQKKPTEITGIDIAAGSLAVTGIRVNGTVQIAGTAIAPLPDGTLHEGEVIDPEALADSLKALFAEHKLAKRVRLGIGNQQVLVRTLRLPAIADPDEMEAAIRFQAEEQIPMPLDQAVVDHQIVGGRPAEEGTLPQLDVIVVAARRDMVTAFLEPLRRAGLEPVGIDLSAFAMIRALADETIASAADGAGEVPGDATLYCNVGDVTNLAVARGRSCLFARVSTAGMEPICERLVATLGVTAEHASQWLHFVGLEKPIDAIEGDPEVVGEVRTALEDGLGALVDELRRSLDYYGAQEEAVPVGRILLTGGGSAIPGLVAGIEQRLDGEIRPARPQALAGYDDPAAARLTLSYGLGLDA